VISIVQRRRGHVLDIPTEEEMMIVKANLPVAESFGLAEELRSATEGRAFWATQFSNWAPLPESLQADVIGQIRKRRGLDPRPPTAEDFFEKE
jgi:elongation factor 2